MERPGRYAASSQVVLAVLAMIAALYLMRIILIPIALALVLACMFSPLASFCRRWFPFGSFGALTLVLLLVAGGLYVASLTAESLIRGTQTIPAEVERLSGQLSRRINEIVRAQPYLRGLLPDPGTIDRLGDTNSAILIEKMSYGFSDLSFWAVEGFIVLVLVIFMLVEGPMLTHKVIRFASRTVGEAEGTSRMLGQVTRKIRAYLVARTIINLGLGLVIAGGLWLMNIHYALALGLFAAATNFVPYIGQLLGGTLPAVVAMGQTGSIGDALIVAAMYLAAVGVEGYVVTPMVLGRSLDLNGTTVLIACLFWGFLWGLIGLILAMPITVSLKLFFQSVPELNRWAELMSVDWQSPDPEENFALEQTLTETMHGTPSSAATMAPRPVPMGKGHSAGPPQTRG
ncbi:AI-2E family transporter [Aquisphaera insulae]|uniref:AI-2E family transporter n=1 Tax=Aquisphaera insulae TaxID=2712864 RepID=UPI0013EB1389|nr:AI-2E family transporter [Aquisphaera insulae]